MLVPMRLKTLCTSKAYRTTEKVTECQAWKLRDGMRCGRGLMALVTRKEATMGQSIPSTVQTVWKASFVRYQDRNRITRDGLGMGL